jgi:hypothetical protein
MRTFLCLLVGAANLASSAAAGNVTLGQLGADATTIAIEQILDDPASFADQQVRIEGLVTGVCPKKGCWMTLAAEKGLEVRVKVEDDVIVIPADATGHQAVAEGIVRLRRYERQDWIDWQSHLADEKGETFDSSAVGEGPFHVVSLEGLGIEIIYPENP